MQKKYTIEKLLTRYKNSLPLLDLEILISFSIKKNREFVLCHYDYILKKQELILLKKNIQRRMHGEPLAYLIKNKEFFGITFSVNNNTLIPRPETELLVEDVLKEVAKYPSKKIIIDIGTGTGNIIISLAKNIFQKNNTDFFGIDISKKALLVAKNNAINHDLQNKIQFIHGSLLQPVLKKNIFNKKNTIFFIVANLPYLSKKIYSSCKKNVKDFEPKKALVSEKEGLGHYDKLLKQLLFFKKTSKKFIIVFEISPEQKNKLTNIIRKYFPSSKIIFKKDLQKKWRLCKFYINY